MLSSRYESGTIKIKGNVDAELVLHTMIKRDNCDEAALIFGILNILNIYLKCRRK
ncbi:MAG: hypothetical protein WA093_04785 [Minisyncoccales bacterium]